MLEAVNKGITVAKAPIMVNKIVKMGGETIKGSGRAGIRRLSREELDERKKELC